VGSGTLSSAIIQITPRDPMESEYTTVSGTLTVAASRGVARGSIDGKFPGPSPERITGTFACNH
jgi:hypothetical protein